MAQEPYRKPTLTEFGKVVDLTHGGSGASGDSTQTKR